MIVLLGVSLVLLVAWVARQTSTDWGHRGLNWLDGLNRLFCRYYHGLQDVLLPLPEQGAAIVVCNHVSGLDPLLLVAASSRPLRFMIAREEYERWGLQWLFRAVGCIPVDREGRPELALREALLALQRGEVVALFPHGGIHAVDGKPRPLKRGAVRLAEKTGARLYPARVSGMRGVGHTLLAVVLPGTSHLQTFSPIDCGDKSPDECQALLAKILNES